MAAPTGVVTLCSTRRASSTMLRSVRLPLMEAAAKPLAMLRWVRPDQIVMLKLLRESRNKNLDFFATFLRLGAHFRPHKAKTDRHEADLPALSHLNPWLESSEQSLIAKKLQRCRNFCFHDGRIASTGGYRNGRITATGQITQMCVFSVAARAATSRATDRTKRPPCLAGLGWAAARVQRGLLRIGRSGSP